MELSSLQDDNDEDSSVTELQSEYGEFIIKDDCSETSADTVVSKDTVQSDETNIPIQGSPRFVETNDRVTLPFLTKYERTLLLGFRALQITNGSKLMLSLPREKNLSAFDVAVLELEHQVIPFKIKRSLPNGLIEIWDISDFVLV